MRRATDVPGIQGVAVRRRVGARWSAVSRARRALRGVLSAVRQIVGAPDYQRYLEHHAARHPGRAPLSARDFYADFLRWQFGSGGPTRCC